MRARLRWVYLAIGILVIVGGAVAAVHHDWGGVVLTAVLLLVVIANAAYGERGARRPRGSR